MLKCNVVNLTAFRPIRRFTTDNISREQAADLRQLQRTYSTMCT